MEFLAFLFVGYYALVTLGALYGVLCFAWEVVHGEVTAVRRRGRPAFEEEEDWPFNDPEQVYLAACASDMGQKIRAAQKAARKAKLRLTVYAQGVD